MSSKSPELILLEAVARSRVMTWIPCSDPYVMGGYSFSKSEWVHLVRKLHQQGYLEKFVKSGRFFQHRGHQKSLTCFRLTEKGRKALEELDL